MKNSIKDKQNLQSLFTRRALLLAGGQLALGVTLVGRAFYLQITKYKYYRKLSEQNRLDSRFILPTRGNIYDRNYKLLATNIQDNIAEITRENAGKNINKTIENFARIVPLTKRQRNVILRKIHSKKPYIPITLKTGLNWKEVSQISIASDYLPGIDVKKSYKRYYPYGEIMAHITGYIKAPSEKFVKTQNNPLYEEPGFKIGVASIERKYEEKLRGKAGSKKVEINAYGHLIKDVETHPAVDGKDVVLTIDADLQEYIHKRMQGHVGSACLLDINTGGVLAMVSTPSYNPNDFTTSLSQPEVDEYIRNNLAPMLNLSVQGKYAPGSTFKPVVALAALEAGVITPHTIVNCDGHIHIGNRNMYCWKKTGHGDQVLWQGIMHSCDVFFYKIALMVGVDRIHDMAKRMGIGVKTGIDLYDEKAGQVPTKAWKKRVKHRSWLNGETALAGIGQGYVEATPIQLATMVARLANWGKNIKPHLVKGYVNAQGDLEEIQRPEPESLGLDHNFLHIVRYGMYKVVNSDYGTAHRYAIHQADMEMAGKTGTSQVRHISEAERKKGIIRNSDLPWIRRDHGLFIGFAPFDNPKYALSVVLAHGSGGSRAAAVGHDIMLHVQRAGKKREQEIEQKKFRANTKAHKQNNNSHTNGNNTNNA